MSGHGKDLVSTEHYLVYFAKNQSHPAHNFLHQSLSEAKEMHRTVLSGVKQCRLDCPAPIRIPSLLQQEGRKKAPQYPLSLRPLPLLEFRLS